MAGFKRGNRRRSIGVFRDLLEALGVFVIPLGLAAVVFPDELDGKWWILGVGLVIAAAWAAFRFWPRSPQQEFREGATIRLVVGDLFDQKASVMVGMTDTFDTSPDVIDANSVQGSMLNGVYRGSADTFDRELDEALHGVSPIGTIEKEGKTTVYPLGTVAVLKGTHGVRYYCAAYTRMDGHNRAQGTIRSVLESLEQVWECVDKHGNCAPICVPLIGHGQSRIPELSPEVAIRLIAFSFLMRTKRGRVSRELRIVIRDGDKGKIDIDEFQAFLSSLAAA